MIETSARTWTHFTSKNVKTISERLEREPGGAVVTAACVMLDAFAALLAERDHPHTCHDMNPPFPGPCIACEREQLAVDPVIADMRTVELQIPVASAPAAPPATPTTDGDAS